MRRKRSGIPDGDGSARKRQRIVHEAPTFEEIHSARQLMQLLSFKQDLQQTRHGLQSFKVLLDRLNDPEKQSREDVDILHGYLKNTQPREDDGEKYDEDDERNAVYLPDIMETWSFAAKVDNDNLMSAVPVVLALLLKYLSHILELRALGIGICRTLLLPHKQELIARNLSADRGKEFVISPTLRMLREAISFDGGAVAKALFRARRHTYRSLARNMSIRFLGDGIEDPKRTSARTNGVRFLLASLQFLHAEAKSELLAQRDVANALTKTIKDDPPHVVRDILHGLRNYVVRDKKLTRMAKGRLFNAATLVRIASLYSYTHDSGATEEGSGDSKESVSDAAHQFLLDVCTSPSAGVLREQYGCYPQGMEPDTATASTAAIPADAEDEAGGDGLGVYQIMCMDKFAGEVPIYNLTLAELLSNLRPWSSTRQSALAIAIFREAPELIAWYYINKKSFTFEPKISATWVGFSALLFNTIQVALPAYFGSKFKYARVPPPASVVVDQILPLPLSQKTLGRCLVHKSKLVPFFAMRLLAIAMEKLRQALVMHDEAAQRYPRESLWRQSARRVVDEICGRCPPMKDVISTYRGIASSDDLLFREATSRVLRLYYEVTPQVAQLSKFDVSPLQFAVLRQVSEHEGSPQDKVLKMMELENLLAIAGYSPDVRWFSKAEGLDLSPFVALLKVYTEAPADLALSRVKDVLDVVAQEQELTLSISLEQNRLGLAALFFNLQHAPSKSASSLSPPVWSFVDNCVVRCANSPAKYIEMITDREEEEGSTSTSTSPVDAITMTMVEQIHFATATADDKTLKGLADFLRRYFEFCNGDADLLRPLFEQVSSAFPKDSRAAAKLAKGLPKRSRKKAAAAVRKARESADVVVKSVSDEEEEEEPLASTDDDTMTDGDSFPALLDMPPVRELDGAALSQWASKTADELVEDGYGASVILLLASDQASVRKEALVNLAKMAAKMRASTYDEKEQVWLLLSELVETAKVWMLDEATADLPLPSHALSFACHALDVLRNPLHRLYSKVNAFLTAGPVWRLHGAAPLVHDILPIASSSGSSNNNNGGSEDAHGSGGVYYYAELSWLLSYLLDSLRTPADVDFFRTRRLFEMILSAAANPYLRTPLCRQVLRILYRAASISGGSTTLITRSGTISWLEARAVVAGPADRGDGDASAKEGEARIVQSLLQRLWAARDQERVDSWGIRSLPEAVAAG